MFSSEFRDSRVELIPVDSVRDSGFLFDLFKKTHGWGLCQAPIPKEQLKQLIEIQLKAQSQQYRSQFPHGEFCVIRECRGKPIGIFSCQIHEKVGTLIDIAILPDAQGQGIGTRVVQSLLDHCRSVGVGRVEAHVVRDNPALSLWKRLGFEIVAEEGLHFQLSRCF